MLSLIGELSTIQTLKYRNMWIDGVGYELDNI